MSTPINQNRDVVIVGVGIGGSALADVPANGGLSVVILEKTLQHKDVVRAEWLAPWGVLEATELGLTETYVAAGANRSLRNIFYDDLMTREEAANDTVSLW